MPHQQHALLCREERRWFSPQQGLVHSRPWPLHASKVDLLFSTCLVWLVCFLFDIPSSQTSCVNEMLNRPSGSPPRKDESEEKEATTENVEEETTKKKKRRKKKDRTTTTTTPATTTKKEAVSTTEETEVNIKMIFGWHSASIQSLDVVEEKTRRLTALLRMTTRMTRRTKLRTRVCPPHRHPSLNPC